MENKKRVVITGLGIAASNGIGRQAFEESCRKGISGIKKCGCFDTSRLMTDYFGEIDSIPQGADRMKMMMELSIDELLKDCEMAPEELSAYGLGCRLFFGTLLATTDTILDYAEREKNGGNRDGLLENMNQYSSWMMNHLGVRGGCYLSSAACASGTTAAGMAFDFIRNGICKIAVVGGADPLTKVSGYGFHALKSLSSTVCNPYDRDRDGINIGEGSAFFLFEELEAAEKRGARIYGEITGYGLNNDAYHVTSPDPEGKGAVASMRTAMEDGGISHVDYINGHGTGTPINDQMEVSAVNQLFDGQQGMGISSTKALIGHCMGASGALELAAVLLAMQSQSYMPMPRLQNVIEGGENLVISNHPASLTINYAISNSFAFAGNTASVLVSRYPNPEQAKENGNE